MKPNILLIAYTIQLFIVRAIDVLPIEILFDVLFIQETNSVIYQASDDFNYRYSTLDTQGIITGTYSLNGIQDIQQNTRYFIIDNLLYLHYYWGVEYHTIDLNKMIAGQQGYLQTISYPTAAKPCDQPIRNEITHIVLDNQLFMNGNTYQILISFVNSINIVLVNMQYNLYLIEDYLTQVQTTNLIFQDIKSVKLNNPNHIDQLLISDISIITAYDYQIKAFRYFNVQNLTELQSTGEILPFVDYQTFLQHENIILIGTSQYTLTYISSLNKVIITKSPNTSQNSYTLRYYHIIYYAFSYVYQGSTQYLLNIKQFLNITCPPQFVLDSSKTNCICRPNSILQNQSCPCNTQYIDISGDCLPCPLYCNTCSSQITCSLCQTGYLLTVNGTCVSTCPLNFIQDLTKTNCICRLNSTLLNFQCPCNTGYIDVNDGCQQCPLNCDVCTSQAVCSQCSQNYYLTVQGTCVAACPQTFISDSTSKICVCGPNRTLQNQSCPCNTQYFDSNGNCLPCPQYCNTCSSQTICSLCQSGFLLAIDGTCVSTCPLTFIQDLTKTNCVCRLNSTLLNLQCPCNAGYIDVNGECQSCPSNCDVCTSQSVCSQCSQNYYLTVQGTCVSACPQTFIPDSTSKICVCGPNRTLQNQSCPCNTQYFDSNGNCLPCPQYCNTCSSQTICSLCQTGFLLAIDGTCVSTCPLTFIQDLTKTNCVCRLNSTLLNLQCPCNAGYIDVNGDCQSCPSNCDVCTSQSVCSQCSQNYYLTVQGTCVSACPQTFIPDSTSKICVCGSNRTLQNSQCPCNTGYIDVNSNCQQCPQSCDVCRSQSACSQCSQNYYLTVQGTCVSVCPQTFIPDSTSKICVCDSNRILLNQSCPCNTQYFDSNGNCLHCPQYCNTCTSQTICSVCQTGYLLTIDGTCVSTCPLNFIQDLTKTNCVCRLNSTLLNSQCPCNTGYIDLNGDCQSCPSNCDVCTSQAACSQCSQNYYLTVQQTCVSSCPQTFITDSTSKKCVCGANRTQKNNLCPCNSSYVDINGVCQPCSSNCIQCTSQTQCTVCQQNFYLTTDMTCVATCPLTFVVNANQTQCICDINRTLTNNKCPCSSGFIEINNICKQCPQNCNICSSQKTCTVCQAGYYLTVDDFCIQTCPLTFVGDSTKTKCVCDINRTLTNNLCLCNATFIEVGGICQPCPDLIFQKSI
ncbi:hypothetical protein TTHERM_00424410 (macronuclear) [Tetrahymena thermophila SB210]|uniref:EGF-like domain-containing protein n=1 Tax=Tetrahymena thermophila (strain SB210) TaxID=312017 RepID=Q23AL9_TETTS|nr:hypothetical protein TTHERM_00424410 [Tetrahymena thermophila SB210]EAR93473.2 hypothetical protein TTHERM_00424410 [Tetrahymena thermophila SB210]|eukprot:XP_001013718.2 hypothetical protein TTHERM_00424410 [Tetrahymena thermophila SB210]